MTDNTPFAASHFLFQLIKRVDHLRNFDYNGQIKTRILSYVIIPLASCFATFISSDRRTITVDIKLFVYRAPEAIMAFTISLMTQEEIHLGRDWARLEGWVHGDDDVFLLRNIDPQGWFVGKLDGEPVVVMSAVNYDDNYAHVGCYITKPEYRGKGYGLRVFEEALRHTGHRITGLDAVENMVDKYSRAGFASTGHQVRFYSLDNPSEFAHRDPAVIGLEEVPLDQLVIFDRKYFPGDRKKFLKAWIRQPGRVGLACVENGRLLGYGVIRICDANSTGVDYYQLGPLFAEDFGTAEKLVRAFCGFAEKGSVLIDIPSGNPNVDKLKETFNLSLTISGEMMYRNGFPTNDISGVYSITFPVSG